MSKSITFKEDAQKKLLSGINLLADTVALTMGGHGQTVIYQSQNAKNGIPQVTKDGVTVAMHIKSEDPVESLGINVVRDAARKTAKSAGDGTTTSTVLAQAILNNGVGRKGSQRDYIRGFVAASEKVLEYLSDISEEVSGDTLDYVAKIATNNDSDLGGIISKAFRDVGEYGHVWYQPNFKDISTYSKIESGAQIPRGFMDPGFINNKESRTVDLDNPYIFLSTSKINSARQLEAILEKTVGEKRALLIIADVEPQVATMLLANKLKHNMKFNVIPPPHIGSIMRETLDDLADLVGAVVHGSHLGDAAEQIGPELLGEADFAQSDNQFTVVRIEEKVDLSLKISALQKQIKDESEPDRIKTLKQRLAMVAGGIGMVYVGAPSDGELKEKMDRVDDAIHAVNAAKEEGVLPGGGVALKNASELIEIPKGDDDYIQGYKSLLEAIKTPFTTILGNAGLKDPDTLKRGWGVNVLTGKKVDMMAEGIIDPTKATKEALRNAVSVSKTILSTAATIVS